MKKYLSLILFCFVGTLMHIGAATPTENDTVFIELTDSSTMIFPRQYIEQWDEDTHYIRLKLKGDTTVTIAKSHIVQQGTVYQSERPAFESFKFNNKFNDQLFTDAEGVIDEAKGEIRASVGCIGKRLTPSFKLPEGAGAYVDGKRQFSKQSRLRFEQPVRYTVAYPKQFIYRYEKVKDEVWSEPENPEDEWLETPLALTGEMFTTNAPSNHAEDPANMLDGDINTFFHSTWGTGSYEKLPWNEGSVYGDGTSEWPYLQIELPESLDRLKLSYTTRPTNDYAPLGFILQGSNNGTTWTDLRTLTAEADNLPTTAGTAYMSPLIELGKPYAYLRLQMTASQRKNYLVLSEFAIYKMERNPEYGQEERELISPAEYKKGFMPFGRDYVVRVDFLTDHSTTEYQVPRIDITFDDGVSWNSWTWIGRYGKKTYEEATIRIDGGGVYPDMPETPLQIRGRGNSSWSDNSNSKNPYRLKFYEKQKPLGMTKGKSWVLLANKIHGSMTSNALALKVADMVGSAGCNHIVPVELYVNGHYRGSYNFTEKTGFANNSIDIADETNAVMLELDSYYDEPFKYRDKNYNLYVNLKEPDLQEMIDDSLITKEEANERFAQIKEAFNNFTYGIKRDYDNAQLDVESMVRAMLVTDLVRNEELMHPKSWFIYNPDITNPDSLWTLGPVWDFDWSYGYERGKNYFITAAENDLFQYMSSSNIGFPFFKQLLRGSDVAKKAYYRLWTDFMTSGKLDELVEYCDDYFKYAEPSFIHNQDGASWEEYDWWSGTSYTSTGWGDGKDYATTTKRAKTWLTKRANYIYKHLTPYDLSDDVIELPEELYGQPDRVDVGKVMNRPVNVYSINGTMVRRGVPYGEYHIGLQPGIYIVNGKKIVIGR